MNNSIRSSLFVAVLALAVTRLHPVWAQSQGNAQPPVITLTPMVITAVAPSSPLTIVTDPKISRQPLPASDGTDYLKTIPGFSAIRNGGSNGDPVLRGMFGSRLNVLMNGTSMPGACSSRMDAPSSYIAPENFDRLTVIKGPETVIWGPGASAGTVRFDRDTRRFSEPGVRFDGSLTGASFGRNDQAADLTVGNEDFYARATANHSHSDDYKNGSGKTIPSRWNKWNADLALGLTADADTLIELTAGTGDGEARYAGRGMDGTQFKRESSGLRFEKRNLGEILKKVEAQIYDNDIDHVMDNYNLRKPRLKSTMPMAGNVSRRTWGGRTAATLALGRQLDLVTGVDWQRSSHRSRHGTKVNSYKNRPWGTNARLQNIGFFAEATYHMSDKTRAVGGVRVDRARARDDRAATRTASMAADHETAHRQRQRTLTSGFLRYERDLDGVPASVYVGIGHVQRFPDYWELFSPKWGPVGATNAFQGVQPERTTQLDIGAQYKTEMLDLWVSGYAGQVNDFILFDYPDGNAMNKGAYNVNALIAGGELGASHRLTPQWQVGSTIAYAWARNRTNGGALPQIPPMEVRLSASYESGFWSTGALLRLVSSQHRIAQNKGNVVGRDFASSAGFAMVALNTSYAFTKQVKLTVGIDNLFNRTYSEHLNLAGNAGFGFAAGTPVTEPGRTAWARLGVRF